MTYKAEAPSKASDSLGYRPKRFWREVAVAGDADGFEVRLDGRAVRTPQGRLMTLPNAALAEAAAAEWAAVAEHVDYAHMPLTRLAFAAVDRMDETRETARAEALRYAETDRMGLLHHANYLVYFEQARTELLRARAASYKELEDQGYFLVVARLEVKYKLPAHYDDVLTVRTTVTRSSPIRIEHKYEVLRGGALLCEATSTLACVGRDGKLREMPEWLYSDQ